MVNFFQYPKNVVSLPCGLLGFWCENYHHLKGLSPYRCRVSPLWLLSRFFVSCVWAWVSLGLSYLGFSQLLEFVDMILFACVLQIMDIFSHCFFEYFLSPTFFLFSLWDSSDVNIRSYTHTCPWGSVHFFLSICPQLFKLGTIYYFMFHFTDSFFYILRSAVEPLVKVFISVNTFFSSKISF